MVEEHLNMLKKGKKAWNEWIKNSWKEVPRIEMHSNKPLRNFKPPHHPIVSADLSDCDLTTFKELRGFKFQKVNFSNCNLKGIDFTGSQFRKAQFQNSDMRNTKFDGCNCELTNFIDTNLNEASFKNAIVEGANFSNSSLFKTDFTKANLTGSKLMWAKIIETNFSNCDLTNARVYGASIWDTKLKDCIQSNIIITKRKDFEISVDNLEIAPFLYLIISNSKIKSVIETLTSKIVLILGRFTEDRKLILDRLKEKLQAQNYVPVIFDFQKPFNKDFIEPVLIIAQLAKFVIADFSDPKIVLEEVPLIVRNTSTVIIPILEDGQREPVTLLNLRVNQRSITKTFYYQSSEDLVINKLSLLIETGNKLVQKMNKRIP